MAALMLVQVSGLSKSLPATGLVTYERALACVYPRVLEEIATLLEFLPSFSVGAIR